MRGRFAINFGFSVIIGESREETLLLGTLFFQKLSIVIRNKNNGISFLRDSHRTNVLAIDSEYGLKVGRE